MFKDYYTREEEIKLTDIDGDGFDYEFTQEYAKQLDHLRHLLNFLIDSILDKHNIKVKFFSPDDGYILIYFNNEQDYLTFQSEFKKLKFKIN
jgi:hypothetical protein